jgi:DNA repair protein SbcD/Mre11
MEKIRSVYPNAMHIERKMLMPTTSIDRESKTERGKKDDIQLFTGFYKEMMGENVDEETKTLFEEVLYEVMNREEG